MSEVDSTKHKPYGFHEFLIVDLFDVKLSDGDNRPADLEKGIIPLISAGDSNNGVVGYFKSPTKIFKENSITVDMFGYVYYQPVAFQTVSHGRVSILQIKNDLELSENSMLYLATAIKKVTSQSEFGFSKMASSYRIKSLMIQLPVLANNQPDYEYMDYFVEELKHKYVEELKHKYVEELDAWWSQAGFASLSDTLLTGNDRNIITKYQQAQFTQVPLSDMFNIINDKVKITDVDFDQYPEVLAQTANNGVAHSEFGQPSLLKGLTIGMRGSFNTYMHDSPFIIGPNVAGLQLKQSTRDDEAIYLYVSANLNKQYARFSGYTNYPTFTKLKNEVEITVPMTNDDLPDYELIIDYMQVMKKLTVQAHRAWLDEQLAEYQSLI